VEIDTPATAATRWMVTRPRLPPMVLSFSSPVFVDVKKPFLLHEVKVRKHFPKLWGRKVGSLNDHAAMYLAMLDFGVRRVFSGG
jgi:hypothetical protein